MDAFRTKLKELQGKNQETVFEVIPGAGHHSKNKAVIKPKVIEELTNMKIKFEEKNAGSINVFIEGKQVDSDAKSTIVDKPEVSADDVVVNEPADTTGEKATEDTFYSRVCAMFCCCLPGNQK